MNYFYLLLIPAVAFGSCNDNRPYYLATKYYNEHPVNITLTDKQKDLSDIVSLVEGLVDRYMRFNETDSSGQEHLSFTLLPLTEYQPIKVYHAEASYASSDIYKTTYYISYFNKLETRWIWTEHTYNFVRFSCYITTHRTLSCTAAYNKPYSQIVETLVLVLIILPIVFMLYLCFESLIRSLLVNCNQLQLKVRITNLTNKLTERLKSEVQ